MHPWETLPDYPHLVIKGNDVLMVNMSVELVYCEVQKVNLSEALITFFIKI